MKSLKLYLLLTLITGVVYPLLVTVAAQLFFFEQANGSLLKAQDRVVGSRWIAQGFKSEGYFWPRPSAVDYNPQPSGGSNLGPTSQALKTAVEDRKKAGLSGDLLYTSGSGLDPDISPASALTQVARIAAARHLSEDTVRAKVAAHTEERQWGIFGERRVNVLELNLDLNGNPK